MSSDLVCILSTVEAPRIKPRIQLRSATVNEVLVLEKNSWGVRKPKVFLGR